MEGPTARGPCAIIVSGFSLVSESLTAREGQINSSKIPAAANQIAEEVAPLAKPDLVGGSLAGDAHAFQQNS